MRKIACLTAALLLGLLGACSGGSRPAEPEPEPAPKGTPTGDPVTATIGPEGGSLTSADGRLTLNVPAGALAEDTQISIQPITSTAPHGVGGAWRLGPDGQTFAQPVQLVFRYSEAEAGGSVGGLAVAFQDARGFWQAVGTATLDASARTLTVSTEHFSDWTLFEWLRLDPHSSTVKINQSIALTVLACVGKMDKETLLTSLLPECRPVDRDDIILSNAAVNGVAGGNAAVGTVRLERPVLTYTAPGQRPQPNPVAVSLEVESFSRLLVGGVPKVLLVASVRVVAADTWAGTISREITQSNAGGDTTIRIHADVAFEFDESTGDYRRAAGSVTVDYRNRQPSCETTRSGAASIAPGDGFLSIVELESPPHYLVQGMTIVTVSGTSTCNDAKQPEPIPPTPEAIIWAVGSGRVKPDGRTIDDTVTTSESGEGVTMTDTVRIHLERVD